MSNKIALSFTPACPALGREFVNGYTLDVGDISYVNGLPTAVSKKQISDSAFTSKSFNSAGRACFPSLSLMVG